MGLGSLLHTWFFPFSDLLVGRNQPVEFFRIETLFSAEKNRPNLLCIDEPLNLRLGELQNGDEIGFLKKPALLHTLHLLPPGHVVPGDVPRQELRRILGSRLARGTFLTSIDIVNPRGPGTKVPEATFRKQNEIGEKDNCIIARACIICRIRAGIDELGTTVLIGLGPTPADVKPGESTLRKRVVDHEGRPTLGNDSLARSAPGHQRYWIACRGGLECYCRRLTRLQVCSLRIAFLGANVLPPIRLQGRFRLTSLGAGQLDFKRREIDEDAPTFSYEAKGAILAVDPIHRGL